MLALSLLLTASPAQEPTPPPEADNGSTFHLGAATASARLTHTKDGPLIEVTVTNPTREPLYWYGAGAGCSGSWFLRPPIDDTGAERPDLMSEIIACGAYPEPSEEDLAEWRLDPVESRTVTLKPFFWWKHPDAERTQPILALTRFAWTTEFTLPVGSPEEITYGLPSPMVVFAWEKNSGLRVFVDGADGDTSLPHFDPFDETPFFREGPTPFRYGPMSGEAELLPTDPPSVRIRVTNSTDQRITYGKAYRDGWNIGFLNEEGETIAGAIMCGVSQSSTRPRLAPGESMEFTIAPFELEFLEGIPDPRTRWHYVTDSAWPESGIASENQSVSATLHVVRDPQYGLAVSLRREERGYEPFEYADEFGRSSAALRVGDAWLIAEALRGEPRNLKIRILPVDEQCHTLWDFADLEDTEEFRWEEEPPFGAPIPWHEPEPAIDYSKPGDHMDWIVHDDHPVSGHPDKTRRDRSRLLDWDPHVLEAAWEWRRVVLMPQANPPMSSRGRKAVLLTVRWSQEAGLRMTAEPAPPRTR
jgi:hypothetical protein